jgi:DNA-binding response OmpR family regulator
MTQASVSRRPLLGLRVLVVEDDYFIALELCSALRAGGADIIGPARDLESGLAAVRGEHIDCGVLDINLQGRMGFQIATELRRRDIPAIFVTGYTRSTIPAQLADMPSLEKPVDLTAVCRAVESCVFGAPRREGSAAAVDR